MNKVLNNELSSAVTVDNYKIVVIGDINVGKTSILSRFRYGSFEPNYIPTVGIDFFTKNIFHDDKAIRLILWDTAGQERFRSLIPSYLKNADCIIIVFDITNKESFFSVDHWLKDAKEHTLLHTFLILCGNKSDLKDKRNVTEEEINNFVEKNYLEYVECSALSGEGVKNLFNCIARNLGEINFSKSLSLNVNFNKIIKVEKNSHNTSDNISSNLDEKYQTDSSKYQTELSLNNIGHKNIFTDISEVQAQNETFTKKRKKKGKWKKKCC